MPPISQPPQLPTNQSERTTLIRIAYQPFLVHSLEPRCRILWTHVILGYPPRKKRQVEVTLIRHSRPFFPELAIPGLRKSRRASRKDYLTEIIGFTASEWYPPLSFKVPGSGPRSLLLALTITVVIQSTPIRYMCSSNNDVTSSQSSKNLNHPKEAAYQTTLLLVYFPSWPCHLFMPAPRLAVSCSSCVCLEQCSVFYVAYYYFKAISSCLQRILVVKCSSTDLCRGSRFACRPLRRYNTVT